MVGQSWRPGGELRGWEERKPTRRRREGPRASQRSSAQSPDRNSSVRVVKIRTLRQLEMKKVRSGQEGWYSSVCVTSGQTLCGIAAAMRRPAQRLMAKAA